MAKYDSLGSYMAQYPYLGNRAYKAVGCGSVTAFRSKELKQSQS